MKFYEYWNHDDFRSCPRMAQWSSRTSLALVRFIVFLYAVLFPVYTIYVAFMLKMMVFIVSLMLFCTPFTLFYAIFVLKMMDFTGLTLIRDGLYRPFLLRGICIPDKIHNLHLILGLNYAYSRGRYARDKEWSLLNAAANIHFKESEPPRMKL